MASEAFWPTVFKELNLLKIGPNVISLVESESSIIQHIPQNRAYFNIGIMRKRTKTKIRKHNDLLCVYLNENKVSQNGFPQKQYLSLDHSCNQGHFDSFAKRSRGRKLIEILEQRQTKIEQSPELILFLNGGVYILLQSASLKPNVLCDSKEETINNEIKQMYGC